MATDQVKADDKLVESTERVFYTDTTTGQQREVHPGEPFPENHPFVMAAEGSFKDRVDDPGVRIDPDDAGEQGQARLDAARKLRASQYTAEVLEEGYDPQALEEGKNASRGEATVGGTPIGVAENTGAAEVDGDKAKLTTGDAGGQRPQPDSTRAKPTDAAKTEAQRKADDKG